MSCIILLILLTVKLVHFLSLVNLSHSPITITSSKFNGRVTYFVSQLCCILNFITASMGIAEKGKVSLLQCHYTKLLNHWILSSFTPDVLIWMSVTNFTLYPPIIHAPQMTDAEEEVSLSHATIWPLLILSSLTRYFYSDKARESLTLAPWRWVEVLGGGAPTLLLASEFLFIETRLV